MLTRASIGKGVDVVSTINILGDSFKYLDIGILLVAMLLPSPKICQKPKTVFLTPPDMTDDGIT